MTTGLITLINDIVKYGLQPNLITENKYATLERNLVRLYLMEFEIPDVYDEKSYPNSDRSLPELRKNIESNFPTFGYYKVVLNINDLTDGSDIGTGDAVDDLHDIVQSLLEVKWRLENNSDTDGFWYFRFIFSSHIKDHLLDLLKYMNESK